MGKIAKIVSWGLFACNVALLGSLIYVKSQSYQEILNLKATVYKESGIIIGRSEGMAQANELWTKPARNLAETYGKQLDKSMQENYDLFIKNCRLEVQNAVLKDRLDRLGKGGLEREMVLGLLETEAAQGK